jgi:beta-carotene 15,15'-dioxygenase
MNRQLLHPFLLLVVLIGLLLSRPAWVGTQVEYLLAIAGIFLTGIPHGAMDHHTASFLNGARFQLSRYVLQYLLTSLLYLVLWFLFPGLAFILFLALTAWHFGETDLDSLRNKSSARLLVFVYGGSLLLWLLLKDEATILFWTDAITGNHEGSHRFVQWLAGIPHGSWFVLTAAILLFSVRHEPQRWLGTALFLFFVFAAVYTSLLLGFVVYFAGWHSLKALQHLRLSVFKGTRIKQLIGNTLIALSGSLLVLLLILKFGNSGWIENKGLPALFILLAVLTLPHMVQMHRLYRFRAR